MPMFEHHDAVGTTLEQRAVRQLAGQEPIPRSAHQPPARQIEQLVGQPSAMSYVGGVMPETLTAWLSDDLQVTDHAKDTVMLDPTGTAISVTGGSLV